MIKLDGHDNAILGRTQVWAGSEQHDVYVYSGEQLMGNLIAGGMDPDEAAEFIDYNIECAYMGPETPLIMWPDQDEYTH